MSNLEERNATLLSLHKTLRLNHSYSSVGGSIHRQRHFGEGTLPKASAECICHLKATHGEWYLQLFSAAQNCAVCHQQEQKMLEREMQTMRSE